jgi:hypothetical protein
MISRLLRHLAALSQFLLGSKLSTNAILKSRLLTVLIIWLTPVEIKLS